MTWSGLLVLVVKCVGKFSLPGGGLITLFFALKWRVWVYIGSMKIVVVI